MNIEEAIIQIGIKQKIKIAQLYKPAHTCYDKPTTGIELKKANSEMVIKDCANMAKSYLPVEVFCRTDNPIKHLRGNVTAMDIKQFATEVTEGDKVQYRVLYSMIFDYHTVKDDSRKKDLSKMGDVYGDYTELQFRTAMGGQKSYNFSEVVSVLEALLL